MFKKRDKLKECIEECFDYLHEELGMRVEYLEENIS
jgi:hypothetical protein